MRVPPVSGSGRGSAGRRRFGPEGQLGLRCGAGLLRLVGCAACVAAGELGLLLAPELSGLES
jgi:hypothetical protein